MTERNSARKTRIGMLVVALLLVLLGAIALLYLRDHASTAQDGSFQDGVFLLSVHPGIHEAPFDLIVSLPSAAGARIYYTIDGNEPQPGPDRFLTRGGREIQVSGSLPETGEIGVYDRSGPWEDAILATHSREWAEVIPAEGAEILQGTAFRFRAFVDGEPITETITATYIIAPDAAARFDHLPIVSVTAPYEAFIDIYSHTDPWDPITRRAIFHYEYFEYRAFTGDREDGYVRIFSLPGSTNLGGTGTRGYAQRTLNVHVSRGELDGRIAHPVFPGLYELRRFRLWNGGNAFIWDHMRDPFAQTASAELHVPHADHALAILFINGEFWGFTTMREHTSNARFISTRLGVNRRNVAMMDRGWRLQDDTHVFYDRVAAGDEELVWALYEELVEFVSTHDLSTDEARARLFAEFWCQDNFMDYVISNTFFLNLDWPHNNLRFFRAITPIPDSDNPYEDGRWRFILHDMDHAPRADEPRYTESVFSRLYTPPIDRVPTFNHIFLVFNNRTFVEQFVERALVVLESEFETERLLALHEEFVSRYLPLLPDMYNRFAIQGTVEDSLANFEWRSALLAEFLENRAYYYRKQLDELLARVS